MDKGTVLLVDDEPIVLQLHAAAVRHFGFHALIAESAEEGLKIAREQTPSLVISDVQMPGDGGFDFIQALVQQKLKTMPAIYLTGYDDIDIIRGGLRAGGDDFITKGISAEGLRRRIAFWMVSGFSELPAELRRRALITANAVNGDGFHGIANHFSRENDLVRRVAEQIRAELDEVPADYGKRLIERVSFMARLAKLQIEESRDFADFVRFPENLFEVVRLLDLEWVDGMASLFKHFDEWAEDERFGAAGVSQLKETVNLNWYD